MKKIFCDKCGKEIFTHSLQAVRFPHVRISVLYNVGQSKELDICEVCQEYFCTQLQLLYKEGNRNI